MSTSAAPNLLSGRHAVVIGASRGIGAAIAERLAGAGARLTLIARDAQALERFRRQLAARHGPEAGTQAIDATDGAALASALGRARSELGPPVILVNNVGAAESAPFLKTEPDTLTRLLELNLGTTFRACQAVLPAMLEADFGRIINVASTAGLKGYRYVAAYCAAKHAVIGLTRALALELARTGVTVNALCPGFVETEMTEKSISNIVEKTGRSREQARAELARFNPQGRLIDVVEVAATVEWLCRPEAASVTGQALAIAGGEVM